MSRVNHMLESIPLRGQWVRFQQVMDEGSYALTGTFTCNWFQSCVEPSGFENWRRMVTEESRPHPSIPNLS